MASTIQRLERRFAAEESGFTLIELLIVLVIIGILLAIAVPSYLGFKDRANRGAAEANVRSAVPAVEAYYADHGNYDFDLMPDGVTAAATALDALSAIDAGVTLAGAAADATNGYCIYATRGGFAYQK